VWARPGELAAPGSGPPRMAEVGANAKCSASSGHPPVRMEDPLATPGSYETSAGLDRLSFAAGCWRKAPFYPSWTPETARWTPLIGETLRLLQRHWRGIRPAAGWSSGGGRAVQRDPAPSFARPRPWPAACLEGVPVRLDRARSGSAAGPAVVGPPAQAIGQLRSLDRRHPICLPSSSHQTPLTIERSRKLEEIPIADPGGAALGKHLLERAGRSCSKQLVGERLGQNAILQGPSQGGPVRLQALVGGGSTRRRRRIPTCGGAPLARLIGPGPPPARRCHDDCWLRQKKQFGGGTQLTPHDSADHQPRRRDDRRHDRRLSAAKDGREWMLATGAVAWPWTAWPRLEPEPLSAASPPAAGLSCYLA